MENHDLGPKKGTVSRVQITGNPPTGTHWLKECAERVAEHAVYSDGFPDKLIENVGELLRAVSSCWGPAFIANAIGARPSSFGVPPLLDLARREGLCPDCGAAIELRCSDCHRLFDDAEDTTDA